MVHWGGRHTVPVYSRLDTFRKLLARAPIVSIAIAALDQCSRRELSELSIISLSILLIIPILSPGVSTDPHAIIDSIDSIDSCRKSLRGLSREKSQHRHYQLRISVNLFGAYHCKLFSIAMLFIAGTFSQLTLQRVVRRIICCLVLCRRFPGTPQHRFAYKMLHQPLDLKRRYMLRNTGAIWY